MESLNLKYLKTLMAVTDGAELELIIRHILNITIINKAL